jgi:hypothetical protein
LPQLTPAPGNPGTGIYAAAAWIGLTRGSPSWTDGSAPWCPGEPNNKFSTEGCANLMMGCGASGAAVNDYTCELPLRVLCAIPSGPDASPCGAWAPALWLVHWLMPARNGVGHCSQPQ